MCRCRPGRLAQLAGAALMTRRELREHLARSYEEELCEQFLRERVLQFPKVFGVPASLPAGLKLDLKYLKDWTAARTRVTSS